MSTALRAVDGIWVEPIEKHPERMPAARQYPEGFLSWLQTEEERARDTTLNQQRKVAIDFYNGEPFGDEQPGRSQIVTRDVAEVIDYMVPSVLRTMVSGDRVVEFEALDSGFKDILEEATEAVSQQFMQEQSGWRILHDSLKAGLLEKTGAIKSYVEEERKRQERDVTAGEFAQLQAEGIEIIGQEPIGEWAQASEEEREMVLNTVAPEQLDQLGPIFRVAWIETKPRFVDVPLPNEEFGVAPDARSLEEALYYVHRTRKTLSQIREMGLDADLIETQGDAPVQSELSRARDVEQNTEFARDGANREYDFLEEYVRYDLDGDGVTEFLRVQRVDNVILTAEPAEYGPCEEWTPFPMPHRRVGQSLADKVMDIQRTRSVLMRQAFDNLYQSNFPRTLVNEQALGDNTLDDLLTFRPGAIIRYRGPDKPQPYTVPFVAGHAFTALEVLTGERESRTGITRLNQGLDADALNKTATGTALMQAQGQQIEEYIARNFAEFVGRVFAKKYRLMKDFGRPFQIIVDGQPVTVDPSQWPDQMRVMVRVGLGAGNKQQRVQNYLTVLRLQQEAAQAGDPHVTGQQVFNTVKGLIGALQLGQATDFYSDPSKMPEAPDEPDPEAMKAQAQVQMESAKLQAKAEAESQKSQIEMMKAQAKHELEMNTAQVKLQLEQMRNEAQNQLQRDRAAFEQWLATMKFQFERERKVDMAENRPGGDLSV